MLRNSMVLTTLKDKKIVIVGCGAQGLNQGLNLRDSGLGCILRLAGGGNKGKTSVLEERYRK